MRLLAVSVAAFVTFAAAPAFAQSGWGMSQPTGGHVGELSRLSPAYRYWDACRTEEADVAAHACGRVIGARVSRVHNGAAYYFRSVALEAMGNSERALSDLRRAYTIFAYELDSDADNAFALYGRGLTLIRLGDRADGEADIARAVELSDGEAERFFDAPGAE
jgi:tetratricopeptide (TPR) repeat protein